jgi:uncharacterized protein
MAPRVHDPRRLDVAAIAADALGLEGRWPLAGFTRLLADQPADAPPAGGDVVWRAQGERRAVPGGEPEVRLHLEASARVHRTCQRCLQPVELALHVDRRMRFVADENRAAELDAESDEDVLALERALDLHELVEDELLLALPMVPRHERCPQPLPTSAAAADAVADAEDAAHPFAALAGWRGKPPTH